MAAYKIVFSLFLCLIFSVGCSSSQNPFDPFSSNNHTIFPVQPIVGVTEIADDGMPSEGMGLLGLFSITVNTNTLEAEILSLRQSKTTDFLEVVDITNFLTSMPCIDCVKLISVGLDDLNRVVLRIGIKHPFPAGNPNYPITGKNRADLHVFNVEGIVVSNSHGLSFNGLSETVADLDILNIDGYTGYLDESLDRIYPTEATIHPYRTFFTDYGKGNFDKNNPFGFESVTSPPPDGWLVMPMGSNFNYKDYTFDIPEPVNFIFAVGCSYGISTVSKWQRFEPDYRCPQFNKKAASLVASEIETNYLKAGNTSSEATMLIEVVDVNHRISEGSEKDQMLHESKIKSIQVEISGITAHPVDVDLSDPYGTGSNDFNPLVYDDIVITNELGALEGEYTGLIKVTDSYPVHSNSQSNVMPFDGISRVQPGDNPLNGLFLIDEFATFRTFKIKVYPETGCGGTTGDIIQPPDTLYGVAEHDWVYFEWQAQSSNGGEPIGYYDIDVDYDGVNFHSDVGTREIFTSIRLGDYMPQPCEENIPYTMHVAIAARDSCIPPNVDIFAIRDIVIEKCSPIKNIPVGMETSYPVDIAHIPSYGCSDILMLYSNGQVWRFFRDSNWQTSDAEYLFTARVNPYDSSGKICNYRLDATRDGFVIISADSGTGAGLDSWPVQVFDLDGNPVGNPPFPQTGGPVTDVLTFEREGTWAGYMGILAPETATGIDRIYLAYCPQTTCWWYEYYPGGSVHGSIGYDKLDLNQVKGVESINGEQFWVLEDSQDYYCARFRMTDSSYVYDNSYFGVGYQTDDDEGWNEARDITADREGAYVLDKLSNGKGVVKFWDSIDSNEPRSGGHMDIPSEFSSNPLRIQAINDPWQGETLWLWILHGDVANGYYLSVFHYLEFPW